MLPPAPVRVWQVKDRLERARRAERTGTPPDLGPLSREITDHPWVGLDVVFPFPEVGTGVVRKCLVHPRGELMFDVRFPGPVPRVVSWCGNGASPGGCAIVSGGRRRDHRRGHRYFATELRGIVNGDLAPCAAMAGGEKSELENADGS